jgi:hypothetical protein
MSSSLRFGGSPSTFSAATVSSAVAATAAPSTAGLEALVDRDEFEVEYDAVVAAVADRFALRARYNIGELHAAYAAWVTGAATLAGNRDGEHFTAIVAKLIESLARRKSIGYELDGGQAPTHDRRLELALGFPNELTALVFGAAVYARAVGRLTDADPTVALSRLILENAIALLRRNPGGAAARFRELLQLSMPGAS